MKEREAPKKSNPPPPPFPREFKKLGKGIPNSQHVYRRTGPEYHWTPPHSQVNRKKGMPIITGSGHYTDELLREIIRKKKVTDMITSLPSSAWLRTNKNFFKMERIVQANALNNYLGWINDGKPRSWLERMDWGIQPYTGQNNRVEY